ncbi:hypothetical protein [Methanocaldococcus sp.]
MTHDFLIGTSSYFLRSLNSNGMINMNKIIDSLPNSLKYIVDSIRNHSNCSPSFLLFLIIFLFFFYYYLSAIGYLIISLIVSIVLFLPVSFLGIPYLIPVNYSKCYVHIMVDSSEDMNFKLHYDFANLKLLNFKSSCNFTKSFGFMSMFDFIKLIVASNYVITKCPDLDLGFLDLDLGFSCVFYTTDITFTMFSEPKNEFNPFLLSSIVSYCQMGGSNVSKPLTEMLTWIRNIIDPNLEHFHVIVNISTKKSHTIPNDAMELYKKLKNCVIINLLFSEECDQVNIDINSDVINITMPIDLDKAFGSNIFLLMNLVSLIYAVVYLSFISNNKKCFIRYFLLIMRMGYNIFKGTILKDFPSGSYPELIILY